MTGAGAGRTIVTIMGPTTAGKTDVAIALADQLSVDLISVDSAMIYRGMDIGTAKPDAALLRRFPHQLIDIRDPSERYSVAQFLDDARAAAKDSLARGRLPILVGGTMLYFKAFKGGIATLPAVPPHVRAELASRAHREGLAALHRELVAVDPRAATGIHPNNPQRLLRALEIYAVSGRPISAWWDASPGLGVAAELDCRLIEFAIVPPREILKSTIERRLGEMLEAGFEEEVRALRDRGDLDAGLPSIRAVGYRQVWEHVEGRIDRTRMIESALRATRQLAKRQLTWLQSWRDVIRLDPVTTRPAEEILQYLGTVAILRRRS